MSISVRLGFVVDHQIGPLVTLADPPTVLQPIKGTASFVVSYSNESDFWLQAVVSAQYAKRAKELQTSVRLVQASGCLSDSGRRVHAYLSPFGKVIFKEVAAQKDRTPWCAVVTLPLDTWAALCA